MLKKLLKFIVITSMFFLMSTSSYAARFYLSPASSQTNAECEYAVNIMIDTQGVDSTASDALINFNPAEIEIVDQNSSIAGTQIKQGNVYEFYPGNKVEGGTIYLTGASIMSPYNSSSGPEVYGSIILKSKAGVSSTNLSFNYTAGSTTDSNISDVTGSVDLLSDVGNASISFQDLGYCGSDTRSPWLENRDPNNGATGVALDENLYFEVVDDKSGVDIDSLEVTIDGELYLPSDSEFSYVEMNGNLRYGVTIDPRVDYVFDSLVNVRVEGMDIATNTFRVDYSFNEPYVDNDGPYLTNEVPHNGAKYDPSYTVVSFNLNDDLSGVEDTSISVDLTMNGVTDTYNYGDLGITISGGDIKQRTVVINPIRPFEEEVPVTVDVYAEDKRANPGGGSFSFNHEIEDLQAPYVRDMSIASGDRSVPLDSNISFAILDNISGVDLDTVLVTLRSKNSLYEEIFRQADFESFSGDKMRYDIEIDPAFDFPINTEMQIIIEAEDFKANKMTFNRSFNKPAVCGDFYVEIDFGEECEPPTAPYCNDDCTWGECAISEIMCGNLIVEEGEECEPPNSLACDASCQYIVEDEIVTEDPGELLAYIGLDGVDEESFSVMIEDTDGDGLSDLIEEQLGTDIRNADSDEDGVSDAEEYLEFSTNPLVYDSSFDFDLKIVDPVDGYVTGNTKLFIRGIAPENQKLDVYAISLEGDRYDLGESISNFEGKFVLRSQKDLLGGEYILKAEILDENGDVDIESDAVEIFIDLDKYLSAPTILTIDDVKVEEGKIPEVFNQRPIVSGTTEAGSRVMAVFESSIFSSTILSDSQTGFFSVFAPNDLEYGMHKVTVYAINDQGVVSDIDVLDFKVSEKKPLFSGTCWWCWILILIVIIVAAYLWYRYKKKKREEEIERQKNEDLKNNALRLEGVSELKESEEDDVIDENDFD